MIAAAVLLLAAGAMTACGQRARSVEAEQAGQTIPAQPLSEPATQTPDSTSQAALPADAVPAEEGAEGGVKEAVPAEEGVDPTAANDGKEEESASSDGSDPTAL